MGRFELWSVVATASHRAWKKNLIAYLVTAVLFFLAIPSGLLGFLLFVLGFANSMAVGLDYFGLSEKRNLLWWLKRLPNFVLMLVLLFIAGIIAAFLVIVALGPTGNAEPQALDNSITKLTYLILIVNTAAFYRLWPALVGIFLVETKLAQRYPWERSGPLYRPEADVGPSLFKIWHWSGGDKSRGYLSELVVLLFSALSIVVSVGVLLEMISNWLSAAVILSAFAYLWPILLLTMLQACWVGIMLAGETPAVAAADLGHINIPEIQAAQKAHMSNRSFINRFTTDDPYSVIMFPSASVGADREGIISEIKAIGAVRQHGEGLIYLWSTLADMKNDMPCELILDLQGAVLAVQIFNRDGLAFKRLRNQLTTWQERYPMSGDLD
ncbi:MAG: hypothetical protein KDD66_07475 [Bdellovibrionales bacterium]|nr:hypothetical protein [Bdellovibrionales bacterium]